MPLPYSYDLRTSVMNALEKGLKVIEIVEIFGVKKSAIYNWKKRLKQTGDYKASPQSSGRKPILSEEEIEQVKTTIINKPDITLEELKEKHNLPICISALCRIINNKLKLNYKKKHFMQANKRERM